MNVCMNVWYETCINRTVDVCWCTFEKQHSGSHKHQCSFWIKLMQHSLLCRITVCEKMFEHVYHVYLLERRKFANIVTKTPVEVQKQLWWRALLHIPQKRGLVLCHTRLVNTLTNPGDVWSKNTHSHKDTHTHTLWAFLACGQPHIWPISPLPCPPSTGSCASLSSGLWWSVLECQSAAPRSAHLSQAQLSARQEVTQGHVTPLLPPPTPNPITQTTE